MTQTLPFLHNAQSFIQENWNASGFQTPTPVQEQAAQLIMDGKDVIAESPTGTGRRWRMRCRSWSGSNQSKSIRRR